MKKWLISVVVIILFIFSSFVSGLVLRSRVERDRSLILATLEQREKIGRRDLSSGEFSVSHEKAVRVALMDIQTLSFQKLVVKEDKSLDLLREKINLVFEDIVRISDNSENCRFTLTFIDSNRRPGEFFGKGDLVGVTFGGGFIFLDKAIFKHAKNEAMLAGVIAHEMGHSLLQHGTRRDEYKNYLFLPFNLAYYFGFNAGWGIYPLTIEGKREAQEQEEADIIAIQYLFKSGYDPGEYLKLLRKSKPRFTKTLEKELLELKKTFPNQKLEIFRHMREGDFLVFLNKKTFSIKNIEKHERPK